MLFSGKIRFHDVARLTARCVLFAAISHYSPLFTTIRDYSYYSRLFAVRYSRLFAIRYSGVPDTPGAQPSLNTWKPWPRSEKLILEILKTTR